MLIAWVVVFGLLGGLYYATATRLYQAKASLLVLQTGADVTNTTMTAEGVRQGLDAHLREDSSPAPWCWKAR